MGSFFAMGGYAVFVWPAYAAVVGGMGILAWRSIEGLRRARRLVASLEADQHPRATR